MKHFLGSPAARRTAWLTLVALLAGIGMPVTGQRAEASPGARTAYLVPFATDAEGVVEEIPLRMTSELTEALKQFRSDPRVGQPLDLLSLNLRDPVIRQAIEEGQITESQVLEPPATADEAFEFARALGLTTVLVGSVESYTETEGRDSATLSVNLTEYYVPVDAALAPSPVSVVSRTIERSAETDRDRALLRTAITHDMTLLLCAVLLQAPELAPVVEVEGPVVTAERGKKPFNALWALLGVIGAIGLIFLISSATGSSSTDTGGLTVNGVRAVSEDGAVRVTWDVANAARAYNVYRRAIGNQPVRSRQGAGFEVLLNPATNATPTVTGGNRTSFIDNTAQPGTIYEYAVAGVGENNQVGPLSNPDANSTAGASIGIAPTLSASGGDSFVSLSWTGSSLFVTGYVIFRRAGGTPDTSPNSPDVLVTLGNVTRHDDQTVENGVSYTYVVQPITEVNGNQQLTGVDSNPVTVVANQGSAPQAPRNVVAAVDQAGQVRLSWDANPETNLDFYEILRRRDTLARTRTVRVRGGATRWVPPTAAEATTRQLQAARASNRRATRQQDLSGFSVIATRDATQTTLVDGPLPDGLYTYAIRGVNTAGVRGQATLSESVSVNSPLAAPGGLTAAGGDRMVELEWEPVAGDVATYNVYRSTTPIDAGMTSPATAPGIALVGTVPGTATQFVDQGLTNNLTFYYAVTSVDSGGAESEFGKGGPATADTGVVGIPHAAPTSIEFTSDKQNLSGNGQSRARLNITIETSDGDAAGGVQVQLSTDAGTFAADTLPPNAQFIDDTHQQVLALTDLTGVIDIELVSSIVIAAGQQQVANVQATAPELPDAVETQSQTISFLASRPVVILLNPASPTLTADGASTTDVTATVLDALGEPVPATDAAGNLAFDVQFSLQSTNGAIRRAGSIQQNPFVTGNPAEVVTGLVNGVATSVYRAGTNAVTGQNVVPIAARARDALGTVLQTAQTLITLEPGAPAQLSFLEGGNPVTSTTVNTGASKTITVQVRDAQGNPVRSGVVVQMSTTPQGVVTVANSGTTDGNGQFDVQITGGANPGGAVVKATIAGTQVQGNLAVTVN